MTKSKNEYSLPYKGDYPPISHPQAHFAHFKHAIDFPMPIDTPILAAKNGEVIDVQTGFKKGGKDPKYTDKVNYITIKHGNGEFTQYAHLKHKGALVSLGDRVKEGQPIGMSGNTGYSSQPHLHFHVCRLTKNAPGWETLEARFKKKIVVVKDPEKIKKILK